MLWLIINSQATGFLGEEVDGTGILKKSFPFIKSFWFVWEKCLFYFQEVNSHYSLQRSKVYLSRFWNIFNMFSSCKFSDTTCDEFWSNTVPAGGVVGLLEVVHGRQGKGVVLGE